MRRRDLLQRLGAAAASSAWPLGLNAQQRSQPPLVGIFTTTDANGRSLIPAETDAFHQTMRDLGFVEGQNIRYMATSNHAPNWRRACWPMAASAAATTCKRTGR